MIFNVNENHYHFIDNKKDWIKLQPIILLIIFSIIYAHLM
nr:MAG TPA: hypothetical protein [Caudoviricetes sp.]